MADGSPTVRRRRLGLILRGLREKAGLTGEEVGAAIERSGSWVSRVETGRVGLRGRDLRDLLTLYRLDDEKLAEELLDLAREGKQRGWWSKYADTLSGPYATYIGFEAEAVELRVYETLVVHGLLQTEEYARAMFATTIPPNKDDMIERKVRIRLARQALLDGSRPLQLRAVFGEGVLLRQIGGPTVLRDQLKRLAEASRRPNITLQIIPFTRGVHPGMIGSFTVVRFPSKDDPDIVYIEGMTGDVFAEAEDAHIYNEVFDHLSSAALSPAESQKKIDQAWEALA
ncbi:MAG: helix-turn-helix domain-containing protein [Micromonosporaceae bacterium]